MDDVMAEFRRIGRIFLNFVQKLVSLFAFAVVCVAVGVGVFAAGKHFDIRVLSILGETIIIGGVVYSAWRAIVAEFRALAQIQGWGKKGAR